MADRELEALSFVRPGASEIGEERGVGNGESDDILPVYERIS